MGSKKHSSLFLVTFFMVLMAQMKFSKSFSSPRRSTVASPSSKRPKRNKKKSSFSPTQQKQNNNNNNSNNQKKKKKPSGSPNPASTATNTPGNSVVSVGEAIQRAKSVEDLLESASQLWLPSDPDLKPHLLTQQIHHEKRQRWSSQLLQKMGCIVSYPQQKQPHVEGSSLNTVWNDDRLARAMMASALPFKDDITSDRPEKEGRYICQALEGLHALAGSSYNSTSPLTSLHPSVPKAINLLLERIACMEQHLSLRQVVQARWAAKGLVVRLLDKADNNEIDDHKSSTPSEDLLKVLDERAIGLPFDIMPLGVDWDNLFVDNNRDEYFYDDGEDGDNDVVVTALRDAIPFNFDTIVTRTGSSVTERRGTAWLAEEGIGALAYSGKLMKPHSPLPDVVSQAMRAVEASIESVPLGFFDCALCNHYPTRTSACKFHTDPEHGTMWDPLTCVVAAGDHRRFAFRPIPGHSTWDEWESTSNDKNHGDEATAPAVIRLYPGDIVQMWGTCNDDFHHAVFVSEDDRKDDGDDDDVIGQGRVSLVFKRAMERGGGRRGHGLEGEGRRSRRKKR